MSAAAPKRKKEKISLSTYTGLGISILVHLVVFLFVGSVVIFEGKVPPMPFLGGMEEPGGSLEMDQEIPLIEEEPIELETNIPESELVPPSETTDTADAASSMDLIVSATTKSAFTMPTGPGGPSVNTNSLVNKSFGRKMPVGPGGGGRGAKTLFGFTQAFDGSMEGTMIDFKQDDKGNPTGMNPNQFGGRVREFAKGKSWDVNDLDDYYLVEKRLYATHIYFPLMGANVAPEAFEVADKVEPKMWIVVYRGTCIAPSTGSYRFWGFADDFLMARIDGKLVFDGSLKGSSDIPVKMEYTDYPIAHGSARVGEWFDVSAGQSMTIEILTGEQPGGGFGAYLFIEEKGEKYKKDQWGRPIIPLFHTVEVDADEFQEKSDKRNYPEFIYKGGLFGK